MGNFLSPLTISQPPINYREVIENKSSQSQTSEQEHRRGFAFSKLLIPGLGDL